MVGSSRRFAYAVKAGPFIFLTGHEAYDFATGSTEAVDGPPGFPLFGLPRYRREGDFILKRADGLWAYQLAVVVDDADQGITDVVRGEDLADTTPRQILLQRLLGDPTPRYLHTPLVLGANGEKLSKQKVMQVQSATEPPKKVAAGERQIMADGGEYTVRQMIAAGAPLAIIYPPEGTPTIPFYPLIG